MLKPANIPDELLPSMEEALSRAWEMQRARRNEQEQALADGLESPHARWRSRLALQPEDWIFPLVGALPESGVKLLSLCEIHEVGVILARGGYSLNDVEDTACQGALTEAILFVGLWFTGEPPRRFFGEVQEAREFYNTPGETGAIAAEVLSAIVSNNPFPVEIKKKFKGLRHDS